MKTAVYTHPDCKKHEMGPWHPDSPARLDAIEKELLETGTAPFLHFKEAPPADTADILRVHSTEALRLIKENCPQYAGQYFQVDADTFLNPFSWLAALRSAGAAVAAVKAVIDGEADNAFCLIRPLGHHARLHTPMGFALFNNAAIAVRHALDVCGLKRVAVVDFDVHHGNGTEEAFADDKRVMMVSFYQSPFYPYTRRRAEKQENMVNIPVPAGTDGKAVRQLVTEKWLPALYRHQPEMIVISAGFDAHKDDTVGGMKLVEADYAWITQQVMAAAETLCSGRIVSMLEGGYSRKALAKSVTAHIRVLAGLD